MAKNKKQKNNDNEKSGGFALPQELKRWIFGILFFLLGLIVIFSFFNLAGVVGEALMNILFFLVGKTAFVIPFIFLLSALVFFSSRYKKFTLPLVLAIFLLIFGISGILGSLSQNQTLKTKTETLDQGGWIGYLFSSFIIKLFGFWIGQIIFGVLAFIGALIFWHLLRGPFIPKVKVLEEEISKPSFIKKIFSAKFRVKEIPPLVPPQKPDKIEQQIPELKSKVLEPQLRDFWAYEPPPLELLEIDRDESSSGDTRVNSAIIKKTLQNFDIPVEMSEINIGPTVTQYTLKPAEGVKLSKITALSNDLALALASHPIRIEAPIPGRALVGIEIPNKVRAQVRLRNLISNSIFQQSTLGLTIALGRDVSGTPVYADLAKMPHLLVAGSTGTGKTIFLNSLLLSLLYKNSPATLRLILIDPKRVEFPVYSDLPHLLSPVIYNPNLTCNALRWLTGEMERRFDLLVEVNARDIAGYNEVVAKKLNSLKAASGEPRLAGREEQKSKNNLETELPFMEARGKKRTSFSSPLQGQSLDFEPMPYIVFIVDELADLMATKGREIEAGIVRIAQMARAVGIHLVLATQRPSVEIITGLIKANITSRVTFQVASQVDSRTVFDMAGAEKLLGSGDLLYLSAEIAKPRRIQGPYVSEKEVRRVVNYIKSKGRSPAFAEASAGKQKTEIREEILLENSLAKDLERTLKMPETEFEGFSTGEDSLYEEAKKVVIEAKKASASLLQRRLRIGYARAARLIDMLEEKRIVGPLEGAKPREVYFKDKEEEENDWQRV